MQGNIPMTNNLIRRLARTVIGVYRNQNKTPVCVARDRDEQTLGETMSTMLEYNNKINDIKELNARMFEEFLISGYPYRKRPTPKGRTEGNAGLTTSTRTCSSWTAP